MAKWRFDDFIPYSAADLAAFLAPGTDGIVLQRVRLEKGRRTLYTCDLFVYQLHTRSRMVWPFWSIDLQNQTATVTVPLWYRDLPADLSERLGEQVLNACNFIMNSPEHQSHIVTADTKVPPEVPPVLLPGENRVAPGTAWNELYIHCAKRYLFAARLCSGQQVLDLGCGTGYGSKFLARPAGQVTAVDVDPEVLRYAEMMYPDARVTHRSIAMIEPDKPTPFADASYDVIANFEVIEHVPRDHFAAYFGELGRLLRPDGTLVMSTPNEIIYRHYPDPYHISLLRADQFRDLLEGFFESVQMNAQLRSQGLMDVQDEFEVVPAADDSHEIFVGVCRGFKKVTGIVAGREGPPATTPAATPAMITNRAPLTVIVHTRNEALNIEACLDSVKDWASELVVMDMESEDRTVELARRYTAKVLTHPRVEHFDVVELARNESAKVASQDWVLYLDADERMTPKLAAGISAFLQNPPSEIVAVSLPYKNYALGKWIQHAGNWWPGYRAPMLLRRGFFHWPPIVHAGVEFVGSMLRWPADDPEAAIVHHTYPTFDQWLEKSMRYADAESETMLAQGIEFSAAALMEQANRDMKYYLEATEGWRDGAEGFILALSVLTYRYFSWTYLLEKRKKAGLWRPHEDEVPHAMDLLVPETRGPLPAQEVTAGHPEEISAGHTEDSRVITATTSPDRPVEQRDQAVGPVPFLLWASPLFDDSGYADEARNFVLALDRMQVDLKAAPISWSTRTAALIPMEAQALHRLIGMPLPSHYVRVQHIFPRFFEVDAQAQANVGRTMFETDRIPADWVAKCNEMDEIWVPSDFNLDTFARSGVDRSKLHKIPGAIEGNRFRGGIVPLPLQDRRDYNFLSVFDWSLRKGWDVLLRAYIEEFSPDDDVCLFLKVHSTLGLSEDQILNRIQAYIRDTLGREPNRIPAWVLLTETYSESEMAGLYRAVDVYVMPSRGEGWGRPYMDAMAVGLPVIGTGWSGNTEFMNRANAYLIDYTLVDVPEAAVAEAPAFRGHRWAEPSVAHLRALMREVYSDRAAARVKGARARQDILGKYDRPVIGQMIVDRVRQIAGRPRALIPVHWEGSQFVCHSLAHINREVCLRLIQSGLIDLTIIPYEPDQFDATLDPRLAPLTEHLQRERGQPAAVHVRHQWPPDFRPTPASVWVMIQPWEFGGLPAEWIPPMRDQVDEIWVPSSWLRECYIRSGIPGEKVVIIPNGVDTGHYRPDGPRLNLQTAKRFKFLFCGGLIGRKGIDILLDTYLATFTADDDVCLVIKAAGTDSFYRHSSLQEYVRQAAARPAAPAIEFLNGNLSDDEMASLYRACDALVHPYRGEGFAMPIAEAMASELPVIVTGYGACLDFCDDQTAFLVPAVEVPIDEPGDLPTSSIGYWWAEPDRRALARLMRAVIDKPETAKAVGQRARRRIIESFNWERAVTRIIDRIKDLAGRIPARFTHRMPAVSPTVSIVIQTRNNLDCTRLCLEMVQKYTPLSHEIVFVDYGSTDGTLDFLRSIPAGTVIVNPEPSGCAAALNQGIKAAKGDYVLILGSDVVATEGWLDRMLAASRRDARIGIVAPRCNAGKDTQVLPGLPYGDDLEQLQYFARDRAHSQAGQGSLGNRASSSCLLIKRSVIDVIGGIDPRFGHLNVAEDDFCMRARLSNFRIWIADDVFIHRFEHIGAQANDGAAMQHSWAQFKAKWRLPPDLSLEQGYPPATLLQQQFDPAQHVIPLDPAPRLELEPGYELFSQFLEYYNRQDYPGAVATAQRILADLDRSNSPYRDDEILFFLANGFASTGNYDQAQTCYQATFALAEQRYQGARRQPQAEREQQRFLHLAAILANNQAIVDYACGRFDQAELTLQKAGASPVQNAALEQNRQAMASRQTVLYLQEIHGSTRPLPLCQRPLAQRWREQGIHAFQRGSLQEARHYFQAVCNTFEAGPEDVERARQSVQPFRESAAPETRIEPRQDGLIVLSKVPKTFIFEGHSYDYFYHSYNATWNNERCVEVSIVWDIVSKYYNRSILEVGNVLAHYFPVTHEILDKYEIGDGVINMDVIEFRPSQKYDLIVSISTLEHVGWDETPRDPLKIRHALDHLENLLNHNGVLVVTLPLGYNPNMDNLLRTGKIQFTRKRCLKRVSLDNNWQEVEWKEIENAKYNDPFPYANGLVIGITERK